MAESTKGLEIALKVNVGDAGKLDEVIKRLGKSADELTAKFTAMNAAMTGLSGGGTTSGGAPKAGVPTGMSGAAGKESPLLQQFRSIDNFLKTTYLKTLQEVGEVQRGLLAGTTSRGGVPSGSRPLDKDITTPNYKTGSGPAFNALDANTVNINAQTVNINTGGVGGAPPIGGAGGAPPGGGDGGANASREAEERMQGVLRQFNSRMRVLDAVENAVHTETSYQRYANMLPLKAAAGQQAYSTFALRAQMGGDLSTQLAIREMGGYGKLYDQYGMKKSFQIDELASVGAGIGEIGLAGLGAAALAKRGITEGPAALSGFTALGTAAYSGFTQARRGIQNLYQDMPDVNAQQRILEAVGLYQAADPFKKESLDVFGQSYTSMIGAQRALARGNIGGERAYNIANILPSAYGISREQALSLAQAGAQSRNFRNEGQYSQTLNALSQMSVAGYGQGTMGGLMGMAGMLDVGGGGFTKETDLLKMFGGSRNVQEAAIAQAQGSMVGFGGIASEEGLGTYASMLTSGATNAQQVGFRGAGISGLGQMSQMPIVQAMMLANLQKEMPGLDIYQQKNILSLSPMEMLDSKKMENLIDPYGNMDPVEREAKAKQLGRTLINKGIFGTVASQMVSKTSPLGQMLATEKYQQTGLGGIIQDLPTMDKKLAKGLTTQIAGTIGQIGGIGMQPARGLVEAFQGMDKGVTPAGMGEAARKELVDQQKLQASLETDQLYAGMNYALSGIASTFQSAQSAIQDIISQLANNTTTNITGKLVKPFAAKTTAK